MPATLGARQPIDDDWLHHLPGLAYTHVEPLPVCLLARVRRGYSECPNRPYTSRS